MLLAIPVALIATAVRAYDGANGVELIAKLLISLIVYLPLSFFALVLSVGVIAMDGSKPSMAASEGEKLFGAAIVYIYLMCGYLLCSFINGGFLKPWLVFRSKTKTNVLDLD